MQTARAQVWHIIDNELKLFVIISIAVIAVLALPVILDIIQVNETAKNDE